MRRLTLSLACVVFLATSAWAQLASQTALVGTVTDPDGLVVPGAQVVAVNLGTRDTYETTTNAEGYYNIQFVRTGTYEITVGVTGFQTSRVSGVEVANNQVARTNIVMKVGQLNESLNVVGSAPIIDTDSARISETIGKRAVSELPVTGRNVWTLASTTPGVLGGVTGDIGLNFRGAGQREIQNSLSLDGINSSANLLAATSMRPIADAVEEIQIQTGSTSAEYGSYLGVHINVVTKSGTNTPHGSIFEFFQDDALDERGYFENRAVPKNPRQRNQFGFELDGPVMFPKLYDGRNRTFVTAAYEGVRANTQFSPISTVPTALMRQGNFSEISTPIKDPFTKQPYPGNVIPVSQLSPTAQSLLAYYPLPNRSGIASNLQIPIPSTENVDQFVARGDQNLGNKVRLSVRYNWHDSANSNPLGAVLPTQVVDQPRVNKNTLVSYTHTLSQNLLNDFRIGYHRVDFNTLNPFLTTGQLSAGADLGIPGFNGDVRYNNPGIPTIDLTNAFSGLGGAGTNWYQFDTTFQMSNVAAYNRGSHNVRFGFDLRRLATGRRAANDPRGRFNFTGDMTGNPVADFMLGLPRTVIPPTDQIQGHVGGWRNGFFVNDVWQASRNLTFSLGLRYELNTPVQTYEGLASMLAEDLETIIPSSFPAVGFKFSEPNYKDIAPRLGATYRLKENTVLRAGYGIYYNPNQMNSFTFLTNNPPISPVSTLSSDPANPTLSFDHPLGPAPGGPPDMISPTRILPNARKDQWSVDVQRELSSTTALDLQYVGSNTSHLDRSFFNNTPQPGPGPVDPRRPSQNFRSRRIIQNDLIADYDAISVILRKRMSHGLQADVHYTWSRTRDMATNSNGGGQTMNNYDIRADYGPANWDVPHRFVASYIYDVPFLKDSSQPVLKYVVAGWQVGGVTTIQSGTPVNVTIAADRANIGITGFQRPDLVGAVPQLNCQQSPTSLDLINCFDASAFAMPAQYTFGNTPRNVLRGPKVMITDLTFMKNVPVQGSVRVQIRADIFNAFNNVNYGQPNGVFGSATFGRINATNTTYPNMRQIQLGLKLMF